MTLKALEAAIAISGSACLLGAGLSLLAMQHRYTEKSRYRAAAEWGLVAIQLAAAASAGMQLATLIQFPEMLPPVWMPTLWLRVLFLWVPLNNYLDTLKSLRHEEENERS